MIICVAIKNTLRSSHVQTAIFLNIRDKVEAAVRHMYEGICNSRVTKPSYKTELRI